MYPAELKEYKHVLDPYIEDFLSIKKKQLREISAFSVEFMTRLEKYILGGGKRARPAIMFMTYKMLGGANDDEVVRISMILEFLQAYFLIQDDIFDSASLRRGSETYHKSFEKYAKKNYVNEDSEHFGIVMGTLGSDLVAEFINDVVTESSMSSKTKIALLKTISKNISDVLLGQAEDYRLSLESDFTHKDIYRVCKLKTASYSFGLPMELSGILADVSRKDIDILRKSACAAGVAFQIRDDIMGLYQDEKLMGKDMFSDLREGKKTFLILHALNYGDVPAKNAIINALGNENLSLDELLDVREKVKQSGSLDYVEKMSEEYLEDSITFLSHFPSSEYKKSLETIFRYLSGRRLV
ncbi:hypothetical protein GF357_02860 [Candidatus Dojkabacteria bacterium]|nr:hypothetical protein [Candidatus Dojkabacteria bacterium]